MREAINIGASLTTATSKQTMLEGGLVRNVYAGLSNRHGLLALQLAESGFNGERDGPASLFGKVVSEHFDTGELVRELGDDWHLLHNYFKLHACCRYNHGTLDAIDAMAARGRAARPGTDRPHRGHQLRFRSRTRRPGAAQYAGGQVFGAFRGCHAAGAWQQRACTASPGRRCAIHVCWRSRRR